MATAAALLAALACTDFEAPEPIIAPDVLVVNPTFSRDIQPILTARCATPSCHNFATQQRGLNLEAGFAYDEIVGQDPNGLGMPYIDPFGPPNSYLLRMIGDDPAARSDRPRMPLGRTPLTENQIATIINWVNGGAPES